MIPKVHIMLSKIEPNGTEQSQDMAPEGENEHIAVLKSISEDILQAVATKDSHGLAIALAEFWGAIMAEDEEQDLEG